MKEIGEKNKTNRIKEFLVEVIGQLCGIIQKGQALANVQKTSDSWLFMTLPLALW